MTRAACCSWILVACSGRATPDEIDHLGVSIRTNDVRVGELSLEVRVDARFADDLVAADAAGVVRLALEGSERDAVLVDLAEGRTEPVIFEEREALQPLRAWAELVEEGAPGARGASDEVTAGLPSIRDVQGGSWQSPFTRRAVGVRPSTSRPLVVTCSRQGGFFVTDEGEAGARRSLFVYAPFERPDAGARLRLLAGEVQEFYGLTELAQAHWEIGGLSPGALPDAVPLGRATLGDAHALESLESSLVRVEHVVLGDVFDAEHSTRRVLAGSDAVLLVDGAAAPEAMSVESGRPICRLTGMLRELSFADPRWVVELRGPDDLVVAGECG